MCVLCTNIGNMTPQGRNIFSLLMVFLTMFNVSQSTENNLIWNLECDTYENLTRAVGTNSSISIISRCSSKAIDGCIMKYIFEASDNSDDVTIVLVNEAGDNGNRAERSLQNGAVFHYQFRKLDTINSLIFNVTVFSSNQSLAVNLKVGYYVGCSSVFTFATINFEGCRNNTKFNVAMPNSDIARYMDFGNIICNMNGNGRPAFNNNTEALLTQCNAEAKWEDADNIVCLFPIVAKLEIDGQSYNRIVDLTYSHSSSYHEISLICATIDAENMNKSGIFMFSNQKVSNSSLIIDPSLNGVNISCYIENNYTRVFGTAHKSTSTLNVKFGPYRLPLYPELCTLSNGSVVFYANPSLSGNSITMVVRGENDDVIPSKVEDCCGKNYGVQGQIITPVIKLMNTSNLYLRTNYSGTYEYYRVVLCDSVTIETTTIRETKDISTIAIKTTTIRAISTIAITNSSELIPLMPILAAVAVILLISLMGCWIWGRHLKKK